MTRCSLQLHRRSKSACCTQVSLAHAAQVDPAAAQPGWCSALYARGDPARQALAQAQLEVDLPRRATIRAAAQLTFTFDPPVKLTEGERLQPQPARPTGTARWRCAAARRPTRSDLGYGPALPHWMATTRTAGIYRGDLNFEMYWDDNADKYQRFINILDQADYIFMSSNRQWGTTTRLPERHPLTTELLPRPAGLPGGAER